MGYIVAKMYLTYKKLGETPLECLERLRGEKGISLSIPMTYAGRLDPLAEGLLIILSGDECKDKEKYLGLDKEYEIEVVCGVSTDSYDMLGVIEKVKVEEVGHIDLEHYVGPFTQTYPRYSSKVIAMKDIPEILPVKDVEIYSITQTGLRTLTGKEIADTALKNIATVKGDFRQKEVLEGWQDFAQKYVSDTFTCLKLNVACSSGTYMRSLAYNIHKPSLAYAIRRIRIGEYGLSVV